MFVLLCSSNHSIKIFLLPILGAIADYSSSIKKFLMISTWICCTFILLLFFVSGPSLWWLVSEG